MASEPEAFPEAVPASTPRAEAGVIVPEVTERADSGVKTKTTMPQIAGGYQVAAQQLCCIVPTAQQAIDADELKILAQVLTEKYAEFEVHGQVTQINPGPSLPLSNSSRKPESSTAALRISPRICASP